MHFVVYRWWQCKTSHTNNKRCESVYVAAAAVVVVAIVLSLFYILLLFLFVVIAIVIGVLLPVLPSQLAMRR